MTSYKNLKYKSHLGIDGSKMEKRIYYDKTYSFIDNWLLVRPLLILVVALD